MHNKVTPNVSRVPEFLRDSLGNFFSSEEAFYGIHAEAVDNRVLINNVT